MDVYKIRVGKNGRITIPIQVRREMNLKTGDLIILEHKEGKRVTLRKATAEEKRVHDLTGSLPSGKE